MSRNDEPMDIDGDFKNYRSPPSDGSSDPEDDNFSDALGGTRDQSDTSITLDRNPGLEEDPEIPAPAGESKAGTGGPDGPEEESVGGEEDGEGEDEDDDSQASDDGEGNDPEPPGPRMTDIDIKLTRLEPFYGQKTKDTVTAKAWAEAVDYAQKVTTIDDEKAAAYAAAALKGEAGMWLQSQRERKNAEINAWSTMKKAFLAWFHEKRTAAQRQELQRSLKQRHDETVRAFYNRVDLACFNMEEDWPVPAQGARNEYKEGYNQAKNDLHDVMLRDYFLAGLKAEVRDVVLTANPETLKAAFQKAIDVESSIKEKQPSKAVHEVQVAAVAAGATATPTGDEHIQQIVAAVIRNMNTGNQSNKAKSQKKDKKGKDTRECYYCGLEGHIEPNCFKKKGDAENNVYNPVDKDRSRPHKKPKETAAVARSAEPSNQPRPANTPMVAQPGSPQQQMGVYEAIASGNAYWDH